MEKRFGDGGDFFSELKNRYERRMNGWIQFFVQDCEQNNFIKIYCSLPIRLA